MRRKFFWLGGLGLAAIALALYARANSGPDNPAGASASGAGAGQVVGRGGPMGGPAGGGAFARPPMTVELASAIRSELADHLTIVGNLIGASSVEVVPKASGRLQSVAVRLGDRVTRSQRIAQLEDYEIREQVKQAEASHEVARAMVRQREADLTFAETAVERARNLFSRQLLAKQGLEDAEARYQAATAQLDLARAQLAQAAARLDELRIMLANTTVRSPIDGFISRRYVDPGAFVSQNVPVVAVVDLRIVRLVANLVEKDLRRVSAGVPAEVEVDAYPGERFNGEVTRVAPVLDPSTRTAQIEVEIPNPEHRLKPGMYARVRLTVEHRSNVLVVPRNAVVDQATVRGVFVLSHDGETASFVPVETGLQDQNWVEITRGIDDGARVVTTGAAGLRDGDRVVVAGGTPATPGGSGRRPGMPSRPAPESVPSPDRRPGIGERPGPAGRQPQTP